MHFDCRAQPPSLSDLFDFDRGYTTSWLEISRFFDQNKQAGSKARREARRARQFSAAEKKKKERILSWIY